MAEIEIFSSGEPIVGRHYVTTKYTRETAGRYFTTNPLRYLGAFVRQERYGWGDNSQVYQYFNDNGIENTVIYAEHIVDSVRQLICETQPRNNSNSNSNNSNSNNSNNSNSNNNVFALAQPNVDDSDDDEPPELIPIIPKSSNNSNNSSNSNGNTLKTIESLTGESAKALLECPICMVHIKDIRLNCGHMLCNMCAQQVTECPICRNPVTQKERVFYNKYLKYKQKYLQLKKQNQ
jgi:hypothetical protein